MKFALLFLIIGTLISITIAVNYKCYFNQRYKGFADETLYDCKVISGTIDDESDQDVEGITGRHLKGYSDSDVESFSIKKKNHVVMPHDVEDHFENLKSLDIYEVGLQKIHQEDLQYYSDLEYLSLARNKLKNLDRYLFQNNPKLKVILLYENEIKFVNAAFQGLDNLQHLNFNDNECHSGEVKNSVSRVNDLIDEIYEDCNLTR